MAGLAAALAGCGHSASRAAAPETDRSAMAGPRVSQEGAAPRLDACVNRTCPVTGAVCPAIEGSRRSATTRLWKGQTVGFCCEDCPKVWDGWSDDDRDVALEDAMRRDLKAKGY